MIIGFPPGGGTDIVGRIVAQKLSEVLGQQVLPDNRGGASGQIAAELTAKAPPDGYTVMMAHIAAMSILPSLYPKLPYDPTGTSPRSRSSPSVPTCWWCIRRCR